MRTVRVWKKLLGVEHTIVEDVVLEEAGEEELVVARVRPSRRARERCGRCGRRGPRYDDGQGRRRWRGVDLGSMRVYLEAEAPRVRCREHQVVVASVPWARHDSRFTTMFEQQCTWLAAHAATSTVEELMRTSHRAVTAMITRVVGERAASTDRLAGLRRIGIDEKSYRKGHRYLTIVVDHDTARVVWAADGRCKATVEAFFADLGPERAAALTHVSCDGAAWIHDVVTAHAPDAAICLDAYHVVAWATTAVDEVRRRLGRDLKAAGRAADAAALKGSRWAVLKNPETLTTDQRTTLADLQRTNHHLYRAYLMKEQLREVFAVKGPHGRTLLAGLISWAARSRIPEMLALSRTLRRFRDLIINAIDHDVSNALAEATNTHIQALIRRARGYHTPESLIAIINLTRGGFCPPLPGRTP